MINIINTRIASQYYPTIIKYFFMLFVSVVIGYPTCTLAETATQVSSTTQPSDFEFSGYIDGSYNYLLRKNHFISGVLDRGNDITPNGVTLQQAAITLSYLPQEGLGGLINPIIGRDTYSLSPYGWNPDFGSQWFGFDIFQAYLQYAISSWTLVGGETLSYAGVEDHRATKYINFSNSILSSFSEPSTFLGVQGMYTKNDVLHLMIGINNGWDTIRDLGENYGIELSIKYALTPKLSVTASTVSGKEFVEIRKASDLTGWRTFFNVNGTYHATEHLKFIANYDYGIQNRALLPDDNIGEAVWTGIAGYAIYQFNDQWQTNLRAEIFDDRNGYTTGVAQCWKEATLTLEYIPIKNLQIRVETRHDISNVNSFIRANGTGTSNNQQSYALEGVYEF